MTGKLIYTMHSLIIIYIHEIAVSFVFIHIHLESLIEVTLEFSSFPVISIAAADSPDYAGMCSLTNKSLEQACHICTPRLVSLPWTGTCEGNCVRDWSATLNEDTQG